MKRNNIIRSSIIRRAVAVFTACIMCASVISQNHSGSVKAAEEDDAVSAVMEKLVIPHGDEIRDNLYLLESMEVEGKVVSISWKSSAPDIITDRETDGRAAGMVYRKGVDKDVTLTAVLSCGGVTREKVFDVVTAAKPRMRAKDTSYIFAFFTGTEGSTTDEQIYFATSQDGSSWTDMTENGSPSLVSDIGDKGVRDPYLIRSHDGDTFYLIATDLSVHLRGGWFPGNTISTAGSTNLVVWESPDLVNWSEPRLVDVAGTIPKAGCAWAPEAIYDEETGNYVVYWATKTSSSDNDQNLYYSTTRDFYTFSEPVLWIDRPASIIDTTMIYDDETEYYYRASQDGNITIERSRSIYADADEWEKCGSLASIFKNERYSGVYLEGPEFFEYCEDDWLTGPDNTRVRTWGLMADQYREGRGYLPFRTTSLEDMTMESWSIASDIDFGKLKKRHGTILTITDAEYDTVMRHYGRQGITVPPMEYPDVMLADISFDDAVNGFRGGDALASGTGCTLVASYNTDNKSALHFNGESSYADIVHKDEAGLLNSVNEMTVSYDYKPFSDNEGWVFYAADSVLDGKYVGITASNSMTSIKKSDGSGITEIVSADVPGSRWNHVDAVIGRDGTVLYVNGAKVAESDSAVSLGNILGGSTLCRLGSSYNGGFYNGRIDNFKIRSKAMGEEEIQQAYLPIREEAPAEAASETAAPSAAASTAQPVNTQEMQPVKTEAPAVSSPKLKKPGRPRITLKGNKMTIKKVSGASKYIIYRYNSKTKKYKKIQTVKAVGKSVTVRLKKAAAGGIYAVKALAEKKGCKSVYSNYSRNVVCKTGKKK